MGSSGEHGWRNQVVGFLVQANNPGEALLRRISFIGIKKSAFVLYDTATLQTGWLY